MTVFRDCMVDIETTGLCSDRSAMIQIAAVKFDLKTQDVSTDFFNRCLSIPPWRYWEEGTWDWWCRDKADILRSIIARMEEPKQVMLEFAEWVGVPAPTFWSKPSHFDFQFVSSYCRDYGITMPFNFRKANDVRSFMRGMSWPVEAEDPPIEFKGTAHNAIHDSLHQIRMLFEFVSQQKAQPNGSA